MLYLYTSILFYTYNKITMSKEEYTTGERVKVSPTLTGLGEWITGRITEVEDKKQLGICITMRADDSEVFFAQERWVEKVVSST